MERLRVVTLNIWNRQGPWAQRLPLIRDGLAALAPDVIGLQEVLGFPGLPSQADEIAAGLGWNVHYAPAWNIGGGLTYGNALLSKHPLLDAAVLPLPTPSGVDTRSVAFARLDVPGGPVPLFCTHLTFQHHLGHVRCQQVRALADHVAALAPIDSRGAVASPSPIGASPDRAPTQDAPPIVLGDFNANPDSDEIRFMVGLTPLGGDCVYFEDAWAVTAGAEPGAGPGWTYDRRNPYALRSREPSRRIDYVFARGPDRHLRGEPLAAWIALDQPVDGVWPSDHYAVVADVQIAVRPHDPY